jgi:acetolactate synthase-1/3 small subunit
MNPSNPNTVKQTVLALEVRNHPGVMSHVCGLLSRRAYNMTGIICLPMQDKNFSRIWLLVNEEQRLEQVVKQIQKLHDVLSVERHGVDHRIFTRLQKMFAPTRD